MDVRRQQQVLMNASLIEARDQEERARSRLLRASDAATQDIQKNQAPQIDMSPPRFSNIAQAQATNAPNHPTPPPASNLPKTGPDRSDEPESWTPRARSRDH